MRGENIFDRFTPWEGKWEVTGLDRSDRSADWSAPGSWKSVFSGGSRIIRRNLGSSGPRPDHPNLLCVENHCLAGSSGVTQDDPTLCRKIVQECFVSEKRVSQVCHLKRMFLLEELMRNNFRVRAPCYFQGR